MAAACGTSGPDGNASGGQANSGGSASGGMSGPSGGQASGGDAALGGSSLGGGAVGGGTSGGADGSGGAAGPDCNTGTLTTRLPCQLSQTGLYQADMTTLAEGVHSYSPQFPLWTDGAEKKRWILLPAGEKIDTTDMDFWRFPAGTRFWKEFVRDGVRVETRLIEKQKSGSWQKVAYLWREDQKDADAIPDGQVNASGTEHDVPNSDQCHTCHSQQPDQVLGFSALQLAHEGAEADASEWTLDKLVAAELITAPPSESLVFSSGWSTLEKSVFGYMHGNCGSCHNPQGAANSATGLDMWIKVADLAKAAAESSVYLDSVDADIKKTDGEIPEATKRFDPGSLENSAIYQRFLNKGHVWSMPLLGSEIADPYGQQVFEDFIMSLP